MNCINNSVDLSLDGVPWQGVVKDDIGPATSIIAQVLSMRKN